MLKKKFDIYFLGVKYWFQGQDWKEAKEYAEALVMGWQVKGERHGMVNFKR